MLIVQLNIENYALNIRWKYEIRFTRNALSGISRRTVMNHAGYAVARLSFTAHIYSYSLLQFNAQPSKGVRSF
jgi:hypothetical protein